MTDKPTPGKPERAPIDTHGMLPPSSDHPDRPVTPPVVSAPWVGKRKTKAKRSR
jgi:hypothetical protein